MTVRLTVVGCSGSYPGPESPASCYLLEAEHDGRPHLADPARPRQRRARPAAPVRRPADHRRGLPQPPARRPLPRPVRLLRDAQVPPDRRAAADPGVGTAGHARPDGARLRPAARPGDDRGVRLLRPRRAGRRGRPVPRRDRRRSCTRSTRSRSRSPSTAARSSTPATPAPASRSTDLAADADLLLCEASFRDGGDNPPDLHLTGSECGATADRGRRRAAGAHPHPAVARPAGRRWPRRGPRGRARSTSPWPGWSSSSERDGSDQARVVHDHRDLHAVGRRRACRRAATRAP